MQNIIALIKASKNDPSVFKTLEKEIQSIPVNDYQICTDLLGDTTQECHFFCVLILEKRLKLILASNNNFITEINRTNNLSLNASNENIEKFILFLNYALEKSITLNDPIFNNKLSDLYALTTLYFYPIYNSNFFILINNAILNNFFIGYLIIKKYLFLLNYSTEISPERRNEMRRINRDSVLNILKIIQRNDSLAVEIFTYAIMNIKEYDFLLSKVLEVKDADDTVLDFFNEFLGVKWDDLSLEMLINYSKNRNCVFVSKLIEIFVGSRKEIFLNRKVFEFVFLCMNYEEAFENSIDFFVKGFKIIKGNDKYEEIALEIIKKIIVKMQTIYSKIGQNLNNTQEDSNIKCMVDKTEELVRIISQYYPKINTFLLKNFPNDIPRNIVLILLKNTPQKHEIHFNDNFLNCYRDFFDNKITCIGYIEKLHFDNDSCRLISKIMKKYNKVDTATISAILNTAKNFDTDSADEITISCICNLYNKNKENMLIKNYITEMLNGEWNDRKLRRFHAFLRKDNDLVSEYIPSFYNFFLISNNTIFFNILGIISKKYKNVPQEILLCLYNNIQKYSYKELTLFVNELLNSLDENAFHFFSDPIFKRISFDYEDSDQSETTSFIKSLLNFIERKIASNINNSMILNENFNKIYIDCLIETLNIKDGFVVKKVNEIVIKNNLIIDWTTVLYKLMLLYNSQEMVDQQNEILIFMVDLIERTEKLDIFLCINKTKENIENMKCNILKNGSMRSKREVLKEFLKDVRGKGFGEMFEKGPVVQKMGLRKESGRDNVDVSDFFKQ